MAARNPEVFPVSHCPKAKPVDAAPAVSVPEILYIIFLL